MCNNCAECFESTKTFDDIFALRSASIAHRLLAGEGAASLFFYRQTPQVECHFVACGFGGDGRLLVALPPQFSAESFDEYGTYDVRFTIEKESYSCSFPVVSASLHSLGVAHFYNSDEIIAMVENDFLPPRLKEMVMKGAMLLFIEASRFLIHDASGVTSVSRKDINKMHEQALKEARRGGDLFSSAWGSLNAYDVYSSCFTDFRSEDFLDVVYVEEHIGFVLGRSVLSDDIYYEDAAMCIDIDRTGMTFVRFLPKSGTVIFVPFTSSVSSSEELACQLRALKIKFQ
ncbi:MAG: hypothetical protein J6M18_06425, partial [Actinomycetaceae bacterium]|nr:hypothetical protein [Actinomycetaceae bacterium]